MAARKNPAGGRDAAAAGSASRAPASGADGSVCDPNLCPCTTGACVVSRVAAANAGLAGGSGASGTRGPEGGVASHPSPSHPSMGQHTLSETERAVADRLSQMSLDLPAMAAVSNLYRAAGALRNHFERTVLAPHDLTWTGWVVLWVVWIWAEIETRHVAAEAGISKGTLTGVARTLEGHGLLQRRTHPEDARRVLLSLTPRGESLMADLFPTFNAVESRAVESLSEDEVRVLATALRKVVIGLEG